MARTIVSQEKILNAGKEIILEKGLQGLNIRGIAAKCSVSIGSIYNYFPTKSDLVISIIESVWKEIMKGYQISEKYDNFVDSINSLYLNMYDGSKKYSSFFISHSINVASLDKEKGRERRERLFAHIKEELLKVLSSDPGVKEDVFSSFFKKEDFIDFVFNNLITLSIEDANSCDFLLEVIRQILYK